jgi:hypothetical protein
MQIRGKAGPQLQQQFFHLCARSGVPRVRGYLIEGNKHESALSQAGMWNLKARLAHRQIAIQKNVQIQGARAIQNGADAVPSEVTFNGEQRIQQVAGAELCFDCGCRIQESRLVGIADGRC